VVDVEPVLHGLLRSARDAVGSSCCLFVQIGSDDQLAEVLPFGLDDEECGQLTRTSDFSRALRVLNRKRQAVRLTSGSRSGPLDGEMMHDLLGVPIYVGPRPSAYLLFVDKAGGFDSDDEELAVAFADAAAMRLADVREPETLARREQWLDAIADISAIPLSHAGPRQAAGGVARRLREVSAADYVGVVLIDPAHPNVCSLEAADGLGMEYATGARFPLREIEPAADLIRTGQIAVGEDVLREEGYEPPSEWIEAFADIALAMVVPLRAPEEVLGVTFIGWRRGSAMETLAAREARHVESFVQAAALALQRVQQHRERARALVLEDRERIVAELRDGVIGRLFAIGTRLHSAAGLTLSSEVRERVEDAIEELDGTTRELVARVFHLEQGYTGPPVHDRILREVDAAGERLGFTPRLVVEGTFDFAVPSEVEQSLPLVVRDALTYVAERGSATKIEMFLRVNADQLALVVLDDGALVGSDAAATYLQALSARATRLGGSCEVGVTEGRTTRVHWHVPLSAPAPAHRAAVT
jgi:signal transduction histidine kinase